MFSLVGVTVYFVPKNISKHTVIHPKSLTAVSPLVVGDLSLVACQFSVDSQRHHNSSVSHTLFSNLGNPYLFLCLSHAVVNAGSPIVSQKYLLAVNTVSFSRFLSS